MKHILIIFIIIISISCKVMAQANSMEMIQKWKNNLNFIENKGQITDQYGIAKQEIQYEVKATPGLHIFIGCGIIHYQFYKVNDPNSQPSLKKAMAGEAKFRKNSILSDNCQEYEMYRIDMVLEGTNANSEIIADEKQDYCEHYYTWGINNATANCYNRITYKDIYPNIDWVLYMKDGQMEYDFEIRPGGKVNDIHIQYKGATDLQITNETITATTTIGKINEEKLYCYEKENNKKIASSYRIENNIVQYNIDNYKGTLIIDPALQWATYYGGRLTSGVKITADTSGNVYATGSTPSIDYIATSGSYNAVYNGGQDAFLAKFNSNGSISWATYFGGSGEDEGNSVAVDNNNNIYMAGGTGSTNNIATTSSYQSSYSGNFDAFLAKFNDTGSLLWATYYGGTEDDVDLALACDNIGNIFMAGYTLSTDSIATSGAYQTTFSGTGDAFLAKFNNTGARVWATYFGDIGNTEAIGISCDNADNVYITGTTSSRNNIATPGAYQTIYGGGTADAFIAQFTSTGALAWATYYGGLYEDQARDIIHDNTNNLYVTGFTFSKNGIATPYAYKTDTNGISEFYTDAFLAKFTDNGAISWATYYGGSKNDGADGVATDNAGNVYISGATNSMDGIVTTDAYELTNLGTSDAFISIFNTSGTLLYGTYFGGLGSQNCNSITCYKNHNFYITGETSSPEGIATPLAYDTTFYGAGNTVTFIAKFDSLASTNVKLVNNANSSFNLFPNPANDQINVSWASNGTAQCFGGAQEDKISIMNIEGKEVYTTTIAASSNHATLAVSSLADGVYICVVQNGEGRWYGRFSVVR